MSMETFMYPSNCAISLTWLVQQDFGIDLLVNEKIENNSSGPIIAK